jgi:hypothetical protein
MLAFAATVQILEPARLHVQELQRPLPTTPTTLKVQVTDSEGLAVDGAQISSQAWMTNMRMATEATSTTAEGQGTYLVQFHLSMAGPWLISVAMQATGFTAMRQTLFVQILPSDAFAGPLTACASSL